MGKSEVNRNRLILSLYMNTGHYYCYTVVTGIGSDTLEINVPELFD